MCVCVNRVRTYVISVFASGRVCVLRECVEYVCVCVDRVRTYGISVFAGGRVC